MESPNFSVAMCVYGGDNAYWFDQALKSIYEQTLPPSEIVLLVDGPIPDPLTSVIEKYQNNQRIILNIIRQPINIGHGNARQACIAHCQYDYIAIADADDINLPKRFEKQMQVFMEHPEIDVVGTREIIFFDSVDNHVALSYRPQNHDEIVSLMKIACPLAQSGVMFSKETYEKAGGYLDWYCAEDYYLWLRMYESGAKFYNCQESLLLFNSSLAQMKRRGGWRYFCSTSAISVYMYRHGIISAMRMVKNIVPRFVLQMLLPPFLRARVRIFLIKHQH